MRRVAIIDVGTVTARLAIADVEAGRVRSLRKTSYIVNLGQGVDDSGILAPEACERVLGAIEGFVADLRMSGAEAVSCTLTSAARDARNFGDLGGPLEAMGLAPVVIPGEVEGSLTFLGVAQDFRGRRILVADNGGGSTELAMGRLDDSGLTIDYVRSLDIGCRRVTEKYLELTDPPAPEALLAAHDFAAGLFAPAVAEGGLAADADGAPEALVVCGGTVTSLVAMEAGLVPYDSSRVHLHGLDLAQVEALEARLASLTVGERAEVAGLQAKRAPVILGGAVAITELMRQTRFGRLTASESDLLFGLSIAAAAKLEGTPAPIAWEPTLAEVRPS